MPSEIEVNRMWYLALSGYTIDIRNTLVCFFFVGKMKQIQANVFETQADLIGT